ncbi:MAG: glycoside hydrolase family 88 protein, partial [Anaeroplasmataceae bacterium]|nr:glycoside hydrolase family 88 protein [Anaeroplasmataceae bacterium]
IMENTHKDFEFYKALFIEAIDGILLYQDKETKLFYQVIDQMNRKGNYLETSGSSMIAYALLKGSRIGILNKEYQEKGLEILHGICKKYLTIVDGKINLGGICLLAGLGNALFRDGSFEYYISEPIVENDAKGVGPFLMAYIESLRI